MAIERVTLPKTVKQLFKTKDKLNFSIAIQRGENIWDIKRKSLLIHSLIYGYPVPAFYAEEGKDEKGTMYHMLDGKQRLTSIFSFISDEFKLSEVPPIEINGEEVDVSGMKFSQLPEDAQDEILSTNFTFYVFKNITETERSEIFTRLNNGAPMKSIETLRVFAGTEIMNFVCEMKETPFFKNKVMITKAQRNRYVDEELILQIVSIIMNNGEKGIGSKDLREFIGRIRDNGISAELQETIRYTTLYLDEAFDGSEKFLKKAHMIGLFNMAIEAQKVEIQATDFADWVEKFFVANNKDSDYHDTVSRGSASSEQIKKRLAILKADFETYLKNTFEEHAGDGEGEGEGNNPINEEDEAKNELDKAKEEVASALE